MEIKNTLQQVLPRLKTCEHVTGSYLLDYSKNGPSMARKYTGVFFVYFLVNNLKIDYIGISESLYTRLVHHKCEKQFQHVFLLTFKTYNQMLEAEKQLIDVFNPPLNKMTDFIINRNKR